MKWKVKPYPDLGQQRVITRFAWFPVRLHNNVTVWLETYQVRQEYCLRWGGARWDTWREEERDTKG